MSTLALIRSRAIAPAALKTGALDNISRSTGKINRTYHRPNVKANIRRTFFCFVKPLRLFIAWMGRRRMMKSVNVLNSPLVFKMVDTFKQYPGRSGFIILARGIHSKILTNVVEP